MKNSLSILTFDLVLGERISTSCNVIVEGSSPGQINGSLFKAVWLRGKADGSTTSWLYECLRPCGCTAGFTSALKKTEREALFFIFVEILNGGWAFMYFLPKKLRVWGNLNLYWCPSHCGPIYVNNDLNQVQDMFTCYSETIKSKIGSTIFSTAKIHGARQYNAVSLKFFKRVGHICNSG